MFFCNSRSYCSTAVLFRNVRHDIFCCLSGMRSISYCTKFCWQVDRAQVMDWGGKISWWHVLLGNSFHHRFLFSVRMRLLIITVRFLEWTKILLKNTKYCFTCTWLSLTVSNHILGSVCLYVLKGLILLILFTAKRKCDISQEKVILKAILMESFIHEVFS